MTVKSMTQLERITDVVVNVNLHSRRARMAVVARTHAQPGSRPVGRLQLFTSLVMNEPTFYAAFTFRRFLISLKPTERHRVNARCPLSNLPRTGGFCNEATVASGHATGPLLRHIKADRHGLTARPEIPEEKT